MIGHQDRYALVTGASTGIGYELAKLLAKDGKNLIIVSRDKNRLERVKTEVENEYQTRVKVLPRDLSDPKAPSEIFSEVEKEGVDVDVLVNSAGFGVYGLFPETDFQEELEMIQLHISSLTHLTKLFLKKMLENKFGRILNVASLIGFLPVPLFSVYSASKAYTKHFSEALACELQGTGVSVTCLCPSPTDTLFNKRGNVENSKTAKWAMMDAATVAQAGYMALKKGKVTTVPGVKGRLLVLLTRIAPRSALIKLMKSMV
jgi:short-subunit dehydrogenase